jgi:DnaJ-class molecular chaperone
MISMKTLKSYEASTEVKCPACDGTGFPTVAQPAQPERKIYAAPCKQCSGKGRISVAMAPRSV